MNQQTAENFDSAAWKFASTDLCKRKKISPNRLAYNKSSGTLAVIVRRSSGGDFALSQGGLDYLLDRETLKDGSPVQEAIVVLADGDLQRVKPVQQFSAEEMRDRFNGVEPMNGKFGPYWWIPASVVDDGVF